MFDDVTTLSFDLDDTLWPIEPVILSAERATTEWLAVHYPRIGERLDADAIGDLRHAVLKAHPDRAHDLTFLRKSVLARMAELAGYTDALVESAFAVFDTHRNQVNCFPDALEVLQRLSQHYTLVAVTNGNANLERVGLSSVFDAHVSAAGAGAAKPDVVMFRAAERIVNASSEQIVHIGDHPEHDVHGARAAGQHAIWLNREGRRWPEQMGERPVTVENLWQLEAHLLDVL